MCHCWRLMRQDGIVTGFTDHDRTLEFGGTLFEANSGFTAAAAEAHLGMAVGGTEVAGSLNSASLLETDLNNGLYDSARVEIWQVNWNDIEQRVLMDVSVVGEVRRSKYEFSAELRSLAHVLDQERGRLFQSACSADLGDHMCRVDLTDSAFQVTVALIESGSGPDLKVDTIAYDSGWFSDGLAEFITGANAGAKFTIKSFLRADGHSNVTLWAIPGSVPVGSDQVRLVAGCDKEFSTCRKKFLNKDNFRGFPHIPGNDALLSHPGSNNGLMDGGSLFKGAAN